MWYVTEHFSFFYKPTKKKINSFIQSSDISVFETNIRYVGGLLAAFALTGDPIFKEKAQYVADKLLPAFQTPTGIPYALINFRTGSSKNYGWASGGSSILSEFGTLHLEFVYLSDITGNSVYRERVMNIRTILKELEKPKGLYPNYLNPKTGKWGQRKFFFIYSLEGKKLNQTFSFFTKIRYFYRAHVPWSTR
jgi:Glycosyl hydrolase family 47